MRQNYLHFLILATLLLGAKPVPADTLPATYPFRRPVAVKPLPSDAPGDNVAWLEFHANGLQKADGSDFRVTAADRTIVPYKILQVSKDTDFVRLAFSTKGDGPYLIWWGNPNAERLPELQIRRGILLEISSMEPTAQAPQTAPATTTPSTAPTTTAPGPAAASPDLPLSEPHVLAAFLLPSLSLANNPLADLKQLSYHYSATFKIEAATTAQMRLGGTGTIEIDGRALPARRPGQTAQVTLAAGWHTLDLRLSSPSVTLTWQKAGERTFTPFPTTSVPPAARATAGNLESPDGTPLPDILIDAVAEVPVAAGTYAQRYTFEAVFPETLKPTIEWSFGDGQTFAGLRKVNHIFLNPGVYPVTVKLKPQSGGPHETTVRITIPNRMLQRMPTPPADVPATVRAILKDYDLETLRPEDAFRGMQYFASVKDADLQIAWAHAWLTGQESMFLPVDEVVSREALAVARLQIARKNYRDAAETLRLAAAKPIGMDTRINLSRLRIMTLCDDVNDAPAALLEAQSWLTRIVPTNPLQVRTANVALAYALIATGDGKAAQAAIDAATAPPPAPPAATRGRGPTTAPTGRAPAANPPAPPAPTPANAATWRPKVEDALTKKDFDGAATLLAQWELANPSALWNGTSTLLRVKLLAATARNLDAARIASQHAKANPNGPNAAELLFRAAEQYQLGGDAQQAQAAREQLQRQHPNSPFALTR